MGDMIDDAVLAGYRIRPPSLGDADAILRLVSACNTPIIGFADATLDDVRDELSDPGWDGPHDGWLVFDASGRLVGYGWAYARGASDQVNIEVITSDDTVADWLLDRTCERGREMARERGHAHVTLDKRVYRQDRAMRSRLAARGFAAATTFRRMRIDHDGTVATPEPPAGLTVREATDDTTRRAAHEVNRVAFADHFGRVDRPYDAWFEIHEARSTFAWPQLWLAELDGRPVAMCECNDQFIDDENCGYVASLGVHPDARGRGIASYLLRRAFAVHAAAGRVGTILHVDANNTTPALGLYESVGMRSVLAVDSMRLTTAC